MQTLHGDEKVIGLVGPGQNFGESVMFIDQPYRSTAESSGTQRVAGYLLSRLRENRKHDDATVTLPARKGIIASQLNLTHEHFSRILHDLVAQGMIEVRGREIRLTDLGKLRAYAE